MQRMKTTKSLPHVLVHNKLLLLHSITRNALISLAVSSCMPFNLNLNRSHISTNVREVRETYWSVFGPTLSLARMLYSQNWLALSLPIVVTSYNGHAHYNNPLYWNRFKISNSSIFHAVMYGIQLIPEQQTVSTRCGPSWVIWPLTLGLWDVCECLQSNRVTHLAP